MRPIPVSLAIICMVGAPFLRAEIPAVPPIFVEADQFQVDLDKEKAVWRGNVLATQGNYTFRAGSLTVRLEQLQGGTGDDGARSGGAATADGYELSAETLTYDLDSGEIVGRGNSELRRGEEFIRCEQLVYQVAERRAIATPAANGRVSVQFFSDPDSPLFPTAVPTLTAAAD